MTTITNDEHDDVKKSAVVSLSYTCGCCYKVFSKDYYSKKQINRYEYKKIKTMKCIHCIETINNKDSNEKRSCYNTYNNLIHTVNTTADIPTKTAISTAIITTSISKSKDPSLTYINDPLNTPIIQQTQQFAKSLNCKYKIKKISKTSYWRTVVKLAVRSVVVFKSKSTTTTSTINNNNNHNYNNNKKDDNYHNAITNNSNCSSTGSMNDKNNNNKRKMIKTTIGLFKPRTHQVISCLESIAHHHKINEALIFINQIRLNLGIEGYIEGSGINSLIITTNSTRRNDGNDDDQDDYDDNNNCYLKYLILALERESKLVQLTIVWNTPPPLSSAISASSSTSTCDSTNHRYSSKHQNHNHIKQFHQHKSDILLGKFVQQLTSNLHSRHHHQQLQQPQQIFHSIWINYNYTSRYNNNIIQRDNDSWKLVYGQSYLSEIIKTNMIIKPILFFSPNVFRQANICAFTKIIQKIRKFLSEYNENKRIIAFNKRELKKNSLCIDKCRSSCSCSSDNDHHKKKKTKKMRVVDGNSKSHHHVPPYLHHNHHHNYKGSCIELYGGVGTIGLNCVDLLSSLLCSDENPNNKACFDRSYHQLKKDVDEYNNNNNDNNNNNNNHNNNNKKEIDDHDDVKSNKNIDNHDDNDDGDDNDDNAEVNLTTSSLNQAYISPATYITSSASSMACSMNGLYGYDIVIVDPPRKGLDQEVIDALINYKYNRRKSSNSSSSGSSSSSTNNDSNDDDNDDDVINNERLIYVSCGFESFKRDAMKLTGREQNTFTTTTTAPVTTISAAMKNDNKKRAIVDVTNFKDNNIDYVMKKYWRLVHMEGHVLFPGSDHIETLAVFDRET